MEALSTKCCLEVTVAREFPCLRLVVDTLGTGVVLVLRTAINMGVPGESFM